MCPAISVPCGLDDDGLPIGLQLTAPALDEATLLRAAAALESDLGLDAPAAARRVRRLLGAATSAIAASVVGPRSPAATISATAAEDDRGRDHEPRRDRLAEDQAPSVTATHRVHVRVGGHQRGADVAQQP